MSDAPEKFGRYLLLKRLGAGGDVHLARNIDRARGSRVIVVKRLHGRLADCEDFVRRFKHEALLATVIDSPTSPKYSMAVTIWECCAIRSYSQGTVGQKMLASAPVLLSGKERVADLITRARRLRSEATANDRRARAEDLLSALMLARDTLAFEPERLAGFEQQIVEMEKK